MLKYPVKFLRNHTFSLFFLYHLPLLSTHSSTLFLQLFSSPHFACFPWNFTLLLFFLSFHHIIPLSSLISFLLLVLSCSFNSFSPFLAPDDYISVSSISLTFPTGSSQGSTQCVNISINDDNTFEEDTERFSVSLTTTDSSVTLAPDSGEVEIRDNESKWWREGG